jgi:hypothetical protein
MLTRMQMISVVLVVQSISQAEGLQSLPLVSDLDVVHSVLYHVELEKALNQINQSINCTTLCIVNATLSVFMCHSGHRSA